MVYIYMNENSLQFIWISQRQILAKISFMFESIYLVTLGPKCFKPCETGKRRSLESWHTWAETIHTALMNFPNNSEYCSKTHTRFWITILIDMYPPNVCVNTVFQLWDLFKVLSTLNLTPHPARTEICSSDCSDLFKWTIYLCSLVLI